MISSAGFSTIFQSKEFKFEVSAKREYLRKTMYSCEDKRIVKKAEKLYHIVISNSEIINMQNAEGKWTPFYNGEIMTNMKVYEHIDKNNYVTGWYKTVIRIKKNGQSYQITRYYK